MDSLNTKQQQAVEAVLNGKNIFNIENIFYGKESAFSRKKYYHNFIQRNFSNINKYLDYFFSF